jgi:hypothetical protein
MQDELFSFLTSMTEDERSYFLKIFPYWKKVVGCVVIFVFVFGSLMRCVVYSYFRKNHRVSSRPINLLILLDQILTHVLHTFFSFFQLFRLFTNKTPAMFLEENYNILIDKDTW